MLKHKLYDMVFGKVRMVFMNIYLYCEIAEKQLLHQLDQWWPDYDKSIIIDCIKPAIEKIEIDYSAMPSARYYCEGKLVFNPLHSLTWMLFLYRLSREIYQKFGAVKEADMIYYLNKIMHSIDWFYQVDLPIHFMAEHPLGSVLGKAKYGDFLFVYQGTTVGGNRRGGALSYPVIGNNVVL